MTLLRQVVRAWQIAIGVEPIAARWETPWPVAKGASRGVPIAAWAVPLLSAWLKARGRSAWKPLFPNRNDPRRPRTSATRAVVGAAKRAETEPAEDLPPEPEFAPAPAPAPTPTPAPRVSSTRRPRRTKLDAYLDKVGLLPDKQVANLAGVTSENVRTYRVRRGIPARWRGEGGGVTAAVTPVPGSSAKPTEGKAAGVGQARRGKLTPYMDQIGIVPDARIAELSGTTPANVRAFRLRHDIPARWRGEGDPLPSEETAVVSAAAEEPTSPVAVAEDLPPELDMAAVPVVPASVALLEAYVVTVEGPEGALEYAVVGRDIVEATISAVAGMARAGITGKLVATRFLARVLRG
ncbi:MAG: hypothetical protein ABIO70_01270 [Pseudomonadota bacterium]